MNKKIFVAGILVLFVIATCVLDNLQNHQLKIQEEQIRNLQSKMIDLHNNQKILDDKLNEVHAQLLNSIIIQVGSKGKASYYDYLLPSGWSSKGHRVCASRNFERGTTIRVTNLDNKKEVDCLVTDYGPDGHLFPERVVDLSSYSFSQIAETKQGVINVSVKKVR